MFALSFSMSRLWLTLSLTLLAHCLWPSDARAGIAGCDGIRIEADAQCGIEFSCEAGCSTTVYRKNCATRLMNVCREECETPPTIECTDDCGAFCDSQCAGGIDVICQHNCYPECVDSCEMTCASDVDPERCKASCAATCDGECTTQCADLPPDTSCVQHCEECCTGSCRAIAGMGCQVSCQEVQWEECETEVDTECHAGCEGSGALFCDGEFIAGPDKLLECARGLAQEGIDTQGYDVDLDEVIGDIEASVDLEAVAEAAQEANEKGKKGCSVANVRSERQPWWLFGFLTLVLLRRRPKASWR